MHAMTFFRRSLWMFAFVVPFWLAAAANPIAAADSFAVVSGKVAATGQKPEQVSFQPLDADGRRSDPTKPAVQCDITDVQKSIARALEVGEQVKFVGEVPACKLSLRSENVDFWGRAWAVAVAAALVFGAAFAASSGVPTKFLLGSDNRYSNSQCQLALWFGTAMVFYLATIILRVDRLGWDYLGGVSMTANVMALTGLSALTFGGAKAITAQKVATADTKNAELVATVANQQAAVNPGVTADVADTVKKAASAAGAANAGSAAREVLTAAGQPAVVAGSVGAAVQAAADRLAPKAPAAKCNFLTDLFQNDKGEVDIGDFQMIFVALTAAVIFAIACFNNLATMAYATHASLPDIDSSLLAGFGIGQGAYLAKKAALPLGKG